MIYYKSSQCVVYGLWSDSFFIKRKRYASTPYSQEVAVDYLYIIKVGMVYGLWSDNLFIKRKRHASTPLSQEVAVGY